MRVMQLAPDIPMATHVVATLRVAELRILQAWPPPQKSVCFSSHRLSLPSFLQNGSALPRLTAVHLVVDCFVESRASAEPHYDLKNRSGSHDMTCREELSVSSTEIVFAV